MTTLVTLKTLTDEMIREHMLWLDGQPYIGAQQRQKIRDGIVDCAVALGPNVDRGYALTLDERVAARERICDAINARRKEQP